MKSLLPVLLILSSPIAAHAQESWFCIPGITSPVRLNHGNIECAAKNGRDCMWGTCSGKDPSPVAWTETVALKPLGCGADHKSKFKVDGYSSKGHWCQKSCEAMEGCSAVFVCEPGLDMPLRMHDGDVQCASYNGKDCLNGACKTKTPSRWEAPGGDSQLQPLTCGADAKARLGNDGYSSANHWCRKACDLFACGKTGAELPPIPVTLPPAKH